MFNLTIINSPIFHCYFIQIFEYNKHISVSESEIAFHLKFMQF